MATILPQTGVQIMKSRAQRTVIFTAAVCVLLSSAATVTFAQKYQRYEDAHLMVQKTIDDLYGLINKYPNRDQGRWQTLITRTQKSLSDFDRGIANGKFSERRLKAAINSVKNVLKDDRMGGTERDSLNADIDNLSRLHAVPGK